MTQTVDRRGYGLVELRSRGDLRFLSSTAATPASLPFGGFPRPAPCSPAATCCWRRSASIPRRVPPASRWPASGMRIPLTRSAHCGCNAWKGPVRRHAAVGVRQAGAHGADGGAGRRPVCAAGRDTTGLDRCQHQSQRAAAAGQPDVRQRQGRDDTLWRHGRRIELPVQRRDRRAWLGGGKNGIGNMEHGVVLTGRSFSVDPAR